MIKLNGKEYQFTYSFTQLDELMEKTGIELSGLQTIVKTFKHIPLICSIGTGMSEEEVRKILDEGNFLDVNEIIEAFTKEVGRYFDPNKTSQAQ